MFKNIQLRTPIRIQKKTVSRKAGEITPTKIWTDIGGYKRCEWIGYHGNEAVSQNALQATMAATVRLRYDPRITNSCRVLLGADIYEIISIDDVRMRHQWMELKVVRKEAG